MPRTAHIRKQQRETPPVLPPPRKPHVVPQQAQAAISRWESVRAERQQFMEPFAKLPIEEAMAYLENLRGIIEEGAKLLNDRIGRDKSRIRCAQCGKDLSGTRPNGMPLWIAKKDIRDKNYPDIIRSIFMCSEVCNNNFARAHMGALGGDGR